MNDFIQYDLKTKLQAFLLTILFLLLIIMNIYFQFGRIYSQMVLILTLSFLFIIQSYIFLIVLYKFKLSDHYISINHPLIKTMNINILNIENIKRSIYGKIFYYKFITNSGNFIIALTNKSLSELVEKIIDNTMNLLSERQFSVFESQNISLAYPNRIIRNILFVDIFELIFGISLLVSFQLYSQMFIGGTILIIIGVFFLPYHIIQFSTNKNNSLVTKDGIWLNYRNITWNEIKKVYTGQSALKGSIYIFELKSGEKISISSAFADGNIVLEKYMVTRIESNIGPTRLP